MAQHVIYVGPHEAVDVGGTGLIAERNGDPIEVDDELAEALLESELWLAAGAGKVTKGDLVKRAEALGLEVPSKATKPELERLIAEAEADPSSSAADDGSSSDEEAVEGRSSDGSDDDDPAEAGDEESDR